MKRQSKRLELDRIMKGYPNFENKQSIEIYVDKKSEKEIIKFISSQKNIRARFRSILYHLAMGIKNSSIYRSEPYDLKAMRFSAPNVNPRIYCKEISSGSKKIIMIYYLPNKDFNKASKKTLDQKLKSIKSYEYEF